MLPVEPNARAGAPTKMDSSKERRGPGIGLDPRNPVRRIRAAVREREQRVMLRILSSLNDVDGV